MAQSPSITPPPKTASPAVTTHTESKRPTGRIEIEPEAGGLDEVIKRLT